MIEAKREKLNKKGGGEVYRDVEGGKRRGVM